MNAEDLTRSPDAADRPVLAVPELALVVLVGISGSGKSSFARKHFRSTQVLSSDVCRGMVADDEDDQSATPAAFDVLHHIAATRLRAGRLTVVDATNVKREDRAKLVQLARDHDVLPVVIVLDVPESVAIERNAARIDRDLHAGVVRRQRADLRRGLRGLSREGFRIAHDISTYSFPALAKAALPFLLPGGALLTMTYLGSLRAVPNYNTMGLAKASLEASVRYMAASLGPKGIRVNGISAGPIKTLAAAGIKGFSKILDVVAQNSPLGRNVTIDDVGNVAAFLLSDLAGGVTAEITYVDGGFSHAMGGAGLAD